MLMHLDSDTGSAPQERYYQYILRRTREEREMRLMNDSTDPELVALLDSTHELSTIKGWVDNLNKDLLDSGFDQYQYKAEKRGKKAYIRLK